MAETSTKKRLSATVYYLLTGILLGWPGLLGTGSQLLNWKAGETTTALSLAIIHFLVLGFMLTIAFGVMYQIIPIAFQAAPLPRHVLFWHLPLHTLSVLGMVAGFAVYRFDIVGVSGCCLIVLTLAYFSLVFRSYWRARNKTTVHKSLVWPFLALWLVLLIGAFQALFPAQVTQHLILSHVLVGGLAFWGGLVIVFSYKLVPMFAISHGYKASLFRTAILYFLGVLGLLVAAWLPDTAVRRMCAALGCLLICAALILFVIDVIAIVRARKRRRLVLPLYDAFIATGCLVLGHVALVGSILMHRPSWLYPAAYLFAFGGLIPLMFAYMQKIVPFLWFEYRFSKRPERKTAPLIDEMVPPRRAQAGMATYYIGVIMGLCVLLFGRFSTIFATLSWLSGTCLCAGSIVIFSAFRYVLTIGGRRPDDDMSPAESST